MMGGHKALAIVGATLASAVVTFASTLEHPGAYFARESNPALAAAPFGSVPKRMSARNDLPIILSVTRKMGIPDDLAARVCHVESRCKIHGPPGPRTKHGRHYGAYQTRANVAARFGYRASEGPLVGMVALRYGAAHLADCWKRANGNKAQAARCHVAGPASIARRLNPKAERYAQSYTRQVIAGSPPSWAGPMVVAMRN